MINPNRIVPVVKTDLISLYGVVLKASSVSATKLDAVNAEGDFSQTTNSATVLCSEPVKALNFGSSVTAATVYFVPRENFTGFTKTGATLTVTGEVDADGSTLYSATLSTNALTIAKIGI